MASCFEQQQQDYYRVAEAINFITAQEEQQPTLASDAQHLGMSEQHLKKLFSRWAGISPKRFLQFLTKEHVKQTLLNNSIEDAAFSSGLSTKSRVYDLMVSCEAITPGEYKSAGKNLQIRYGCHPSPFGICMIALTNRGICKLAFSEPGQEDIPISELYHDWKHADIQQDQLATSPYVDRIFNLEKPAKPFHLLLKGTNFQIKVWQALLDIQPGQLTTYADIAIQIENPSGVRAVGTAIAKNPIGLLIPCHRVIRKSGEINQYRWGAVRKQTLIAWEQKERWNSGENLDA